MCNKCENHEHPGDERHDHSACNHDHSSCSHDHHGHGEHTLDHSACNHEGGTCAARDPNVRYYDDPHPATHVEGARNQWELYLREAREADASYKEVLAQAEEALAAMVRQREALGAEPTKEAQKALVAAYEYNSMHWLHGVAMTYFTNIEAIGDAQTQLDLVGREANPDRAERLERIRRRLEGLDQRAEQLREEIDAKYKAEETAIKSACPQYEDVVTKYVVISHSEL